MLPVAYIHIALFLYMYRASGNEANIYSTYSHLVRFFPCTLQIEDLERKLEELHHSTAASLEEAKSTTDEQLSTLK